MIAVNENENKEKLDKWKYYAAVSVSILAVGAIAYLIFRYALPIFVPFLIAFCIGGIVSPAAIRMSEKTKIPRAVCGVLLTLLLLTLVTVLLALAFDRLISELIHLLENLNSERGSSFIEGAVEYISSLTSRLPVLRELRASMGDEAFWSDVDAMLKESVTGTLKKLAEIIPERARERLSEIGRRLKPAAVGWLRAYLLIFIITFVELFVGLSVLRVQYAFLFAALIALVDILPILGTGTVLIPWAVISFLMKDIRLGVGLLVVFGVITVVREVLEPRIVGKSLGISPVLSLISMYAGLRLFGFFGMIIAPATVVLAVAAVGKGKSSA